MYFKNERKIIGQLINSNRQARTLCVQSSENGCLNSQKATPFPVFWDKQEINKLLMKTKPCFLAPIYLLKLHCSYINCRIMTVLTNFVLVAMPLIIISTMICTTPAASTPAAAQFSAMFAFGDSLIDPGNNNYLSSMAKANFVPYGIDFYAGPSGRFCNGKTVIDHLGTCFRFH